jgi:hypothetical protein
MLDLFEIGAGGRLLTAQPGEPDVERLQRLPERGDFAKLATSSGIGLIEPAALCLLLRDGFFGEYIH